MGLRWGSASSRAFNCPRVASWKRCSQLLSGKNYSWDLMVSKFRALLQEPGAVWYVTPGFLRFFWWEQFFSLIWIRYSLVGRHNFALTEAFEDFGLPYSTVLSIRDSIEEGELRSDPCRGMWTQPMEQRYFQHSDVNKDLVFHSNSLSYIEVPFEIDLLGSGQDFLNNVEFESTFSVAHAKYV